jgi:polysaccharide pyruvyl transferase WcaK-like protein
MLENIKQIIVFHLLEITAILFRLFKTGIRKSHSVLILPPSNRGSLGDEAMLTSTIEYYVTDKIKEIGILSYINPCEWADFGKKKGETELLYYSLNGVINKIKFIYLVSRYEYFNLIGADVLDGYYSERRTLLRIEMVLLANMLGAKTTILGSSFNENPTLLSVKALGRLPKEVTICARDQVSQLRLNKSLKKSIRLVADLAFLLNPTGDSQFCQNIIRWINKQKLEKRIVIGINANYLFGKIFSEGLTDKLINFYVNILRELYSKNSNFSFIIIPHDYRDYEGNAGDKHLAKSIFETLPEDIKCHSFSIIENIISAEIKYLVKYLDFVLSGRMHLAIACLGQSIPVVCIDYQGKCEGLFKYFELDEMLIMNKESVQPSKLVDILMPFIEKRDKIRGQIKLRLPYVKNLALANFKA